MKVKGDAVALTLRERTGAAECEASAARTCWLTPQEVADELKVGYKLVWRLIDRKELVAYHIGGLLRVDRADLDMMLAKAKVSGAAHAKRTKKKKQVEAVAT